MGSWIREDRPLRDRLDRLGADDPESARRRRVLAGVLVVVALLGSNAWQRTDAMAWFDVRIDTTGLLLSAALIVTAFLLVWRSRWVAWAGAVSVALMFLGAVFDVMAMTGGGVSYAAFAVSLLIRLPTVVVVAVLVRCGSQW
ncbi:hypothetical protein AB0D10_42110 [Kitasatospora sp. NPDC048545]|uniref:hypothetical protein n=1 Tax=Kitasatospora sp. NPDC048545 TaxID=3157208 RepID=UPI00340100A0